MTVSFKDFEICGQKLSLVMGKVIKSVKPGQKLIEVEKIADDLINEVGGYPSFKKVPGYHWASCVNLNDGIVHGVPNEQKIKKGDLVSLDIGLEYHGWHSDMAYTFQTQKLSDESRNQAIGKFLEAGERAIEEATKAAKVNNRVGNISQAIQNTIEQSGYSCVYELTGHGIGVNLHQYPWIPCVLNSPIRETPTIEEGMGLAIEVIYTMGKPDLERTEDGWTIRTKDGKMSALFEKTVIVTQKGAKVITPYNWGESSD